MGMKFDPTRVYDIHNRHEIKPGAKVIIGGDLENLRWLVEEWEDPTIFARTLVHVDMRDDPVTDWVFEVYVEPGAPYSGLSSICYKLED